MGKVTIPELYKMKAEGKKITMLTAYDYTFARLVDETGIDIILVGDSVATVVQGLENTLPVTMDEMIYHTKMVSRAAKNSLVVGDMPFMSYQAGVDDSIRNAGRFLQEGGAAAVKLEGGANVAHIIEAITRIDIPVMAHIGLTPQSIHKMGGYKVQGKDEESADRLLRDAKAVERAGAFSVVLEAIPATLAAQITKQVSIPTIGIGAGVRCDGQVLVLYDLLGLFDRFLPRFVKRYANLQALSIEAIKKFKEEVEGGKFPSEEHSFN